jgi:hypothetical protein
MLGSFSAIECQPGSGLYLNFVYFNSITPNNAIVLFNSYAVISNSTFAGSSLKNNQGGVIQLYSSSFTSNHNTFSNNTAAAVLWLSDSSVTLINDRLANNMNQNGLVYCSSPSWITTYNVNPSIQNSSECTIYGPV